MPTVSGPDKFIYIYIYIITEASSFVVQGLESRADGDVATVATVATVERHTERVEPGGHSIENESPWESGGSNAPKNDGLESDHWDRSRRGQRLSGTVTQPQLVLPSLSSHTETATVRAASSRTRSSAWRCNVWPQDVADNVAAVLLVLLLLQLLQLVLLSQALVLLRVLQALVLL